MRVLGNNGTAADETLTVVLSVLGGLYGIAAASVLMFIILPRVMGSGAAAQAARPAVGVSRRVRAARPRPVGLRWSPAYRADAVRARPGAYLPRPNVQLRRVTRVSAVPNRKFTPPNPV